MAEPLKNRFGAEVVRSIADEMGGVLPRFDRSRFVAGCLDGYDELELTERAARISDELARALIDDGPPGDTEAALGLITEVVTTAEPDPEVLEGFWYLPFVTFVADHGVDHFEAAMALQRELTVRFTAEFSIRTFIEAHPDATMARLRVWTDDPDEHIRRLVSEGTRPRLPWAPRLRRFQDDPTPVLELLERLRDDESEYVRRSVANNLNDISKDHPELVVQVARRWWADGDGTRRRMLRHGLRTLVKAGDPGALAVLGYDRDTPVEITAVEVAPEPVVIGRATRVEVTLHNPGTEPAAVLVDLRVQFVKADGSLRPKVFKGAERVLEPGASTTVGKKLSFAQHSTRTHHPGRHRVEVMVNGQSRGASSFAVVD